MVRRGCHSSFLEARIHIAYEGVDYPKRRIIPASREGPSASYDAQRRSDMRKLFWLFLFSALVTCGTVYAQESGPLEHPHMQAPPTRPAVPVTDPSQKAPSENLIVPSGTRMPLILHNAITTRNA